MDSLNRFDSIGEFFFDFGVEKMGFDGKQWLVNGREQSISGSIVINAAALDPMKYFL